MYEQKKNIQKRKSKALDLEQNADKDYHGCLSALILDTSLFIFPHVSLEVNLGVWFRQPLTSYRFVPVNFGGTYFARAVRRLTKAKHFGERHEITVRTFLNEGYSTRLI